MKVGVPPRRRTRKLVAAVVLGTALSTMSASGHVQAAEISESAISDLGRYCTACWRNARLPADRWGDCTQEVLHRLLDRVQAENWERLLTPDTEERRELIRAIDAVKKRTLRERRRSVPLNWPVVDQRARRDQERTETRDAVRQIASSILSPRQQRIMHLSFEGCSVQEIAQLTSLTPDRVSDEKYKAIRKLRSHFRDVGVS